jgi:hypothetical protein
VEGLMLDAILGIVLIDLTLALSSVKYSRTFVGTAARVRSP